MAKAAELDTNLINGLKVAKTKRTYFAFVLKGATDGALLVTKTKVPPADIAAAKKQCGGSAVLKGFCQYEDGKYIFETAKEAPATAAQGVKVIVKRDAGLAIHAVFRVSTDPELLADEGGISSAPTPQPVEAKPDGAAVMKRLNGMTGDIKAALNGSEKGRVTSLIRTVNEQLQSKNFAGASELLDELERLVKPVNPGGAKAAWQAARAAAIAKLDAIAAKIKAAKHAKSDSAFMQVKAVMANLPAELSTPQKVSETVAYLEHDDVVLDVCEFAEDIRTPLLRILAQMKA